MESDPLKKLYGKHFPAGTVIFREGEPGSKFYLIQSGQVKIIKELGQPAEILLTTFSEGDFFGEMALFELETRSASAVAETDAVLYELGQRNFENFILHKPRVAYQIIQKLCQRIRKLNELTVERQGRRPDAPPYDVRVVLMLAALCGQAQSGFVVVRPRVDLGELSAQYDLDLSSLEELFGGTSTARFAPDFAAKAPPFSADENPALKRVLDKTLIGAEVVDSRKKGGTG